MEEKLQALIAMWERVLMFNTVLLMTSSGSLKKILEARKEVYELCIDDLRIILGQEPKYRRQDVR